MRTLHQQASAYRRNSLFASSLKDSAKSQPTPHEKSSPKQVNQTAGRMPPLAVTFGFGAQFVVLLLCWLTGAVSGLAPSLLLSSLVGITAFCLGLACSPGRR